MVVNYINLQNDFSIQHKTEMNPQQEKNKSKIKNYSQYEIYTQVFSRRKLIFGSLSASTFEEKSSLGIKSRMIYLVNTACIGLEMIVLKVYIVYNHLFYLGIK